MKNIKILAVDDEVMVRSFIKAVVDKEKLPVSLFSEANNGLDAVWLARELKPDLIFMDIRMPDVDGIGAAEKILADSPEVNIVIISAYGEFEYARSAFRVGVSDYLLKPIRPSDICKSVKRVAALLEEKTDTSTVKDVKMSEMAQKMKSYINDNLGRQLYLKNMAKAMFMSPFHLSRTFKRLTGQTIVDFIHEQRLTKAEELLLITPLNVTEIAGEVGFNDAAYFSTCFKNKTGMSPTQYRKKQDYIKNQQEFKRCAVE